MNKKSLFISIIALCAVIGLLVTACKDEDDPAPPAPTTFTVAFNSNGGSPVDSITGVVSGAKITTPAVPTKGKYTFDGWYKETTLTTAWDFAADTVAADTTLYAKWNDTRVVVAAGSAVAALATDTTKSVSFTGATGITELDASDFSVTEGAIIGTPTVSDGTITVPLSFAENAGDEKEYTVSINPSSLFIKEGATDKTVTVTQAANARVKLTITDEEIPVAYDDTEEAIVFAFVGTFEDAQKTALETVANADDHFIVTGDAEITAIAVDTASGNTVTVTITYEANSSETDTVEYTVSINPTSTLIRGDVTVKVIQAADET
ncbi:MAG: InlB B-repeat-containing protein [Treponema sp.]|jgi:uncharacterized repeat protein (TIGR02543 family)|nr:InlB B-repeat-containing protein [Treponema sp.]